MECNLFEAEERFELIDVDQVVLRNPLEIREPSGFGQIKIILSRNIEDRGGTNFEFGEAETTLGFDRWCGYLQILQIMELTGSDSNIVMNYYRKEDGLMIKKYSGFLVISSMNEEDDELKFRVKREDYGEKLRTRWDVENPVETPFDLDGNEINEIELFEVGLHSKAVDLKYDVINETSTPPVNLVDSYTAGVDPPRSYANEALLQLGAGKVNINTISDVLQPIDYGTRLFKPESGPIEDYIRASFLYNFKVLKTGKITLDMFIKGTFDLYLSQTSGNPRLTFFLIFEVVRPDGTEYLSTKLVPDQVFSGGLVIDEIVDININQSFELDLVEGWNIYIYGVLDYLNISGGTFPVTVSSDYTFNLESLYYGFNNKSFANPSTVKGLFIYEALNRLIQKAVGNNVKQATLGYIDSFPFVYGSFPFVYGEKVIGELSGASGVVYSTDTVEGVRRSVLVGISGGFKTGETISNTSATKSATLIYLDAGKILSSSILERVEDGADEDGVGSLNLVTNGFAIRGFLNEKYEPDVFYKRGDNVTYNKLDYTYINENVERGTLPTDTDYWIVQKGRKISTSIKKIIDFVKYRYGAGFAVIQEKGLGYGVLTDEKVTRVVVEKHSYFFRDVEIMRLNGVENPIARKINKDLLFNTIEVGYKIFSKENEESSISGFNTERKYLTPIKKDKSNLSLMCEVSTDGYEIERLRRLTQSENPGEADDKDDETFIIKQRRVDGHEFLTHTREINPSLYVDDPFDFDSYRIYSEFNQDLKEIYIYGILITGLVTGDKLRLSVGTFDVFDIDYIRLEPNNNRTVLGSDIFTNRFDYRGITFLDSSGERKNIFLTEIIEANERFFGAKNTFGSNDPYSEYNLDHTPTKFLMNNFGFFGGSMKTKPSNEVIRFTSGANNVFLRKKDLDDVAEITTESIVENQDFELSSLRDWSPELFGDSEYTIKANFSYSELEKIRLCMTGESEEGNFGYLTFIDNQGVERKAYPIKLVYKALDNTAELTLWGKSEVS